MPWNWQHTVCLPPGLRPPPFYCHYLPSCGAAFKQVRVCLCVFACLRVLWLSLSAPPPWSAPCLAEKQQSLFHSDLLFIQESMPFFSAETHIITGSATAAAC